MHRRNRHVIFSAKQAGGIIVLDSRTITGVSNGGNVNNWYDLSNSRRNFFKPSNKNAPTLQTNIQGGQPVVRFVETSVTVLIASWTTAENPSSYVWICTEIPRTINANKHLISTDDNSFNGVNFSVAHTTTNLVGTNVRNTNPFTLIDFYPATVSTGTPYVQSLGNAGNQLFFYRGNYVSSTGNFTGTNTVNLTIGGRVSGGADLDTSDLMQFILFNSLITKSLRRRFEIASFFTFKIKDTQNDTNR